MIYRPIETRKMWDTWVFPWEGRYHLFYLETQKTHNDHVGHAVSDDLIHWQTLESIKTKGKPEEWNHRRTATGMVLRHDDKFLMFVGGYDPDVKTGDSQVVGVYFSHDLVHWEEYWDNPVIYPGEPYVVDPSQGFFNTTDWRDSYIMWREDDSCYHGFLCARMPNWNHMNMGSAVAHVRSKNLFEWEYLEPLAVSKQYPNMEVPEVFELNGRYYLTFSTNSLTGLRINTPTREEIRGTFYMASSSFEGPFELPEDPLLIGSAHRTLGAYVGRSIDYKGERLLYHQVGDFDVTRPAWGAPKLLRSNADGTLRLDYFPSLEKLETLVLVNSFMDISSPEINDLGRWVRSDNCLIGANESAGTCYEICNEVSDMHFQCTMSVNSACCTGVILRESGKKTGVSIILDFENQRIQIGKSEVPSAYNSALALFGLICNVHDSRNYVLNRNKNYHLRCFARADFFEVYLDDTWVFTACLPDSPQIGNVELYVERGEAEFRDLRLARIEPLK